MKEVFVINSEADQFSLVWELNGHFDELLGMLNNMGIAAHTDAISESSVLAAVRLVRQIQQLVGAVTSDKTKADELKAEQAEKERREKYVKPFFDLTTDEEKRASLEEFITDDDIAAELRSLEHGERSWAYMIKQDEQRLKLVNDLKAKREGVSA